MIDLNTAPRRRLADRAATVGLGAAVGVALLPLIAVLAFTVTRGATRFSLAFLWHSMKGVGPLDAYGGVYHAVLGTLEQVAIASAIAVPFGLLVAIYLSELGRGRLAASVRFAVDVMTGIPSIVAGLFIYAAWVLGLHRGYSGAAAGAALAILMLPVIIRSSEEMLRLVPNDLREASFALGISRWRTTLSVVLPAASAGVTTGVTLAVARVTGETAPLLLTAFGADAINRDPAHGPQSALPLFVFTQAGSASRFAVQRAWAGALTLVAVVLLLTVIARLATRRNQLNP
ncbi:MAG TPA: phosphate ABC transporter permease PstA [Acidimicrobiales bacterium]|nr:phosphate ABC transporter permease PstA [Acidimicrobiales bacterium]